MGYASVLVGTDGSETARIAEQVATALARATDARLLVVSAYAPADGPEAAQDVTAKAAARAAEAGVAAETAQEGGDPADVITELADRLDAELIVVGDVGMGGPKRFRLGGVADRISHQMPCDLLIVRTAKGERAKAPGVYERVLLATDGSPTADRATRVGAEFASALGASVGLAMAGGDTMATIVLRDAAQRLDLPADAPTTVLAGDPGEVLAEHAGAEGYDAVVVGNKGMEGTLRFLLGVVPDRVSHNAPCDVLIVNTVGRSPEDLEPGEGAIVSVDGKKVAAYREEDGGLITLNPKCKHLGCTVGWNHRAKTWDCPCHGSRYERDGSVKNGPTRHPLDPA